MNMEILNQRHDKAMDLAGQALLAKMRGQTDEANKLFRLAYDLEREVADEIAPTDLEPSRSVIHRSAATLALDCGEYVEAERLAMIGLLGNRPASIAAELREVLMQAIRQLQKAAGD
jgi:hypothetical protein